MSASAIRILVVDDRSDNLLTIKAILQSADYELVCLSSGEEALRYLLESDCALILLDVQMPGMDGFEVARLVKQSPRSRDIPIIFLTANTKETYVSKGYAGGAVDYLFKPLDPDVLRAKVAVFSSLYRSKLEILRQAELLRAHEEAEKHRVLAELELKSMRRERVLQERYRNLVNGISHAIIWSAAHPDSMAMSFVSPSAAEILGYPLECWTSQPDFFLAHLHPEDQQRVVAELRSTWQQKRPAVFEHRFLRADGKLAWLQTSVRLSEGEDRPPELHGLSVDLTRVKEAERALKVVAHASAELASSLDYRSTLERLCRAVVPELADACLIRVNGEKEGGGALVFSHASAELRDSVELLREIPFPFREPSSEKNELIAPWVAPLFTDAVHGQWPEDSAQRRLLETLPIDSCIAVPMVVRGTCIGSLCLLSRQLGRRYDESSLVLVGELARRAAQAVDNAFLYQDAQESIHIREEFLSIASHELRTPLTPLKLQMSSLETLLESEQLSEKFQAQGKKQLAAIQRHVGRMAKLVDSLLDVSRIRTGRLELQLERVDLAAVVQEVLARFREELARERVQVSVRLGQELSGYWDKSRVDQILTNLLSNAIKYGNHRPVEIAAVANDNAVELRVVDNGIGIPGKNPERIFQRFERAGNARSFGGMGLGLYIVNQLVEAHGGIISVKTEEGRGTTFAVVLPKSFEPAGFQPQPTA